MAAITVAALQEIELVAPDAFVRTRQAGRRVEAAARELVGRRRLTGENFLGGEDQFKFAAARAASRTATLYKASVIHRR